MHSWHLWHICWNWMHKIETLFYKHRFLIIHPWWFSDHQSIWLRLLHVRAHRRSSIVRNLHRRSPLQVSRWECRSIGNLHVQFQVGNICIHCCWILSCDWLGFMVIFHSNNYPSDFPPSSQLSRRQRVIQRNRTERLSDLLNWKNLGHYYRCR